MSVVLDSETWNDFNYFVGNPYLASYCDATRVLFDPKFPEILHYQAEMLGERYLACSSVPSNESVS